MSEFILENVKNFNLDHIFDCGQCFRWAKEIDGSYSGKAFGKNVNMNFIYKNEAKSEGTLIIKGSDREDFERIWKDYLDLNRDYGKIKEELSKKDKVLEEAIKYGEGIRILNQDTWETIISFIISQNNNIPRIKGCIESLAENFGIDNQLPTPEKLAELSIDDLSPVRLGYRAKYLIETGKMVSERGLPTNLEELQALQGVGPKVANCISLFALHNLDSFPIDVWVKRVMNRFYGFDEKDVKGMSKFARDTFGEYGGIAQQYLFYYIRKIDLDLK